MSTKLIKSIVATAILVVLAAGAGAQLVAYEGFEYATGPNLNGANGGTGWAGSWQDMGSSILTGTAQPGITWPGLPGRPGQAVTPRAPYGVEWTDYYRPLAAYTAPDNKLYISYLFLPTPAYGTHGGIQIGTYPRQVEFGAILGYYLYGMRIGHYGMYASNIPEIPGQTAFLVLEIQAVPATNTTNYHLYVNPRVGELQPQYPDTQGSITGMAALPTALEIFNDGGVNTDEIRVGTTWDSVTRPPVCRGDCNCDGRVDFLDISPFVAALNGAAACDPRNCDVNGDGVVDFNDINPFVALLSQGGVTCP